MRKITLCQLFVFLISSDLCPNYLRYFSMWGRRERKGPIVGEVLPLGEVPNGALFSTYQSDGDPGTYALVHRGDKTSPGVLRKVLADGTSIMSIDGKTPVGRFIPIDSAVFIVGFVAKKPGSSK